MGKRAKGKHRLGTTSFAAREPRATPFADATVAALAAIAVAVVIVIAAEHAGPLFARVSRARAH